MDEDDFSDALFTDALSVSFRLTEQFLRRHRRYRELLSLTPENFRFDNVLWHSSIAALRGMLQAVAEQEQLELGDGDLDEAVRNLVEGIVLRSRAWD
ncbi:MAG: hypothetical protein KKA32_17345 [Actinobacteria bacterium]|nr:hypothetical protein [Actinomycetota bacterium]